MSVTIYFVTYGQKYRRREPRRQQAPTIGSIDCADLPAPPRDICRAYTGLDTVVSRDLFSHPESVAMFEDALNMIEDDLNGGRASRRSVTVLVSCTAGMHRSVAMAERLAREVGSWRHVTAKARHLDLEEGLANGNEARRRRYCERHT